MPRNRFDLSGKVAIVTGGGRGIGKAIALGLAEHGAEVVLSSRTQTQIEQVAQEIRNLGRKALPIAVDLTKMSDLRPSDRRNDKRFPTHRRAGQ